MQKKNAVAVAEGTIVESLLAGEICIAQSCCLVSGYGRVGSVLASKLKALNANVTITELDSDKLVMAAKKHYDVITPECCEDSINQFDYIFNTVPAMVFTDRLLAIINKETVIIDVASKPGGVDYEYCNKHHINAKLCLGLPGKYVPKTAAMTLVEAIEKSIG